MLLVVIIAACTPTEKATTDTTMKRIDPHSFSEPDKAIITHLDWDAEVDFDKNVIKATADYKIDIVSTTNQIVFDINDLDIHAVEDQDGAELFFEIGREEEFLGQPLTVTIPEDVKRVKINYSTSPGAEAVQWLNPQQTADEQMPFLFTQSQAILCRSWIPIQDSPGIRITYNARVTVPEGMLALMSASNPTEKNEEGLYEFEMKQPIPAYLMALSVGDITYAPVSNRTGVYAEPSVLKPAVWEFAEMEEMVQAAEELYGAYAWDVYDLIVLPPSFPFGGMENPRLTFATPTILAGDRSLTSLVAHELAHSWSGNLVTNATWDDFWLNEGFTVYFEQRIMESVYGRDYSEMLALLSYQDLEATVADLTEKGQGADTKLKLDLTGRNPDDGMTDIAYNKGYFFLRLHEENFGREAFDSFLKVYFDENAFKSMTTESFIEYLKANLYEAQGVEWDQDLINRWIYGEGIPNDAPVPESDRFTKVDKVMEQWLAETPIGMLIPQEDLLTRKWSSHEWLHFIRQIPEDVSLQQMAELDDYLQFTYSGNSEILAAWMVHVIRNGYEPGYENLENFLVSAGRRKFLVPLYGEMVKTEEGLQMARSIYEKARPNYHFVSVNTIDEMLGWSEIVN